VKFDNKHNQQLILLLEHIVWSHTVFFMLKNKAVHETANPTQTRPKDYNIDLKQPN